MHDHACTRRSTIRPGAGSQELPWRAAAPPGCPLRPVRTQSQPRRMAGTRHRVKTSLVRDLPRAPNFATTRAPNLDKDTSLCLGPVARPRGPALSHGTDSNRQPPIAPPEPLHMHWSFLRVTHALHMRRSHCTCIAHASGPLHAGAVARAGAPRPACVSGAGTVGRATQGTAGSQPGQQ